MAIRARFNFVSITQLSRGDKFIISLKKIEERARYSGGTSDEAIYHMVACALDRRGIRGNCIADVGCGHGNLYPYVSSRFQRYLGVDIVRYEGFPAEGEFHKVDLDTGMFPISDGT